MLKGAGGEVEKETLWGMAEVRKKRSVRSKMRVERSLRVGRSTTWMKLREPRHLEERGINNLRCGKGFHSYAEGEL